MMKYLQKLGKSLMPPVACLPICGILMGIGYALWKSIDILTFVVFGGMGSISGSIIATSLLTFLPEALRTFNELRMIIYPLFLIILMLFRPQGLFGNKEISLNLFNKLKEKRQE